MQKSTLPRFALACVVACGTPLAMAAEYPVAPD